MTLIIIGLILTVLAGVCEAIMDTLQFHFDRSIFSNYTNKRFWNPILSWENKYKEDLKTPKFFLSTTLFVFLTDAWHLFKMIRTLLLIIGIAMSVYSLKGFEFISLLILCRVLFGISFTIAFKMLIKKVPINF